MISDVQLDRLCSEDRFTRLDPPGESPTTFDHFENIRFSVVEEDGTVRERLFLEDVQWWRVVAYKMESPHGAPIDPFDPYDWEEY